MKYFAYIRVSTKKQERGLSLPEQQAGIKAYAERHSLNIIEWFEEKRTAAKCGRSVFNRMLALLKSGKAHGVIVFKIDRSARNLRDWANLGELIDAGVDVRFANETMDLRTRGGRLSADIQAVVSADFIRNHRENILTSFYGFLKRGLYPLPAPIGYVDNGKGKAKTIDTVNGPLVRRAFELYATGRYNICTLGDELYRLGLRSRVGTKITNNHFARMLHEEFYIGIIHIKRTNQRFKGIHEPLIPKNLFDHVQRMIAMRARSTGWKHDFLYRRALLCTSCERVLIPERQKGYVYYRCHGRTCPKTSLREETVNDLIAASLGKLRLSLEELKSLASWIAMMKDNQQRDREEALRLLRLNLSRLDERFTRLTDMYMDNMIDKETFEKRKVRLLEEQLSIEERIRDVEENRRSVADVAQEKLELVRMLSLSDDWKDPEENLHILKSASSNLRAIGKQLVVDWCSGLDMLAKRAELSYGEPLQGTARTEKDRNERSSDSWIREFMSQIEEDVLGDVGHSSSDRRSTPLH